MSTTQNWRHTRRLRVKANPSNNLTIIELIESPPNVYRWRGNDGNYYSPTYVKAIYAQNAARDGGVLKKL